MLSVAFFVMLSAIMLNVVMPIVMALECDDQTLV
jgi:hypothetical protein